VKGGPAVTRQPPTRSTSSRRARAGELPHRSSSENGEGTSMRTSLRAGSGAVRCGDRGGRSLPDRSYRIPTLSGRGGQGSRISRDRHAHHPPRLPARANGRGDTSRPPSRMRGPSRRTSVARSIVARSSGRTRSRSGFARSRSVAATTTARASAGARDDEELEVVGLHRRMVGSLDSRRGRAGP
jgi:hypothetical protein